MSIDEQIEILEAYKNGGNVEYNFAQNWRRVEKTHLFNFECFKYRILKEPELVPWTEEDVPIPCWIRGKNVRAAIRLNRLVIGTQSSGVIIYFSTDATTVSWDVLLNSYEYTQDGVTWKPCGKVKI